LELASAHPKILKPGTEGDNFKDLALRLQTTDGHWIAFAISGNTDTKIFVLPIAYRGPEGTILEDLYLTSTLLSFSGDYRIGEAGVVGHTPNLQSNVLAYFGTMGNAGLGDDAALGTEIHELIHSFGLRHNCGEPNILGTASSVANWEGLPVLVRDETGNVIGLEWMPVANVLCADHIVEIRATPGYGGSIQ